MAIEGSCHCGAVKIEIAEAPVQVTSCNCSICRRLGTLWAYYPSTKVRIVGDTATYRWGDKTIDFHHCARCGITTHWSPIAGVRGEDRMGINARLLGDEVLARARVRRLDGANENWSYLD
ncbi:MAG: GFA family protein [Deltaproteobacteria bacterium]|nr:GFA family protein [Deltaproteobacteria bacterium]